MTGWQLACVLALALVLPVICGMFSHCAPSMDSIDRLCTFVAGGMIGLAQASVRAKRHQHKAKDQAQP